MIKKFLTLILCSLLTLTPVDAVVIAFNPFQGENVPGVDISLHVTTDTPTNNVVLTINNNSTVQAVVTRIAIHDISSLLSQPSPIPTWDINNNLNIPGTAAIDFEIDYGFIVNPPPVKNGINSGESLDIIFADINESIQDIIYAFDDGQIRIAMHVQSIGSDEISAAYINDIYIAPESSTAVLCVLGTGFIMFRRSR